MGCAPTTSTIRIIDLFFSRLIFIAAGMAGSSLKKRHEVNTQWIRATLAVCVVLSLLYVGWNGLSMGALFSFSVLSSPMWGWYVLLRSHVKPTFDGEGKLIECGDFWVREGLPETAKDCLVLSALSMLIGTFSSWGWLFFVASCALGLYGAYANLIKPLKDMQAKLQTVASAPLSEKKQRKLERQNRPAPGVRGITRR